MIKTKILTKTMIYKTNNGMLKPRQPKYKLIGLRGECRIGRGILAAVGSRGEGEGGRKRCICT